MNKINIRFTYIFIPILVSSCSLDNIKSYDHLAHVKRQDLINAAYVNSKIKPKEPNVDPLLMSVLTAEPVKAKKSVKLPTFDLVIRNKSTNFLANTLSRSLDTNIVTDIDTKRAINIKAQNININQLKSMLYNSYDLKLRHTSYGYRISNVTKIEKNYSIDVIDSGAVTRQNTTSAQSNEKLSGGASSKATFNQRSFTNQLRFQIQSVLDLYDKRQIDKTAYFAREYTKYIDKSYRQQQFENSRININQITGSLQVITWPDAIPEIDTIVKTALNNYNKQVLISADIIDIELDKSHQNGLDWSSIYGGYGGATALSGEYASGRASYGSMIELKSSKLPFSGLIKALESQGKVNVISSPRIITLNHHVATIRVGNTEKFVGGVKTVQSQNLSSTNTESNATFEDAFSGMTLAVYPIIKNNAVTLYMHPEISRVTPQSISVPNPVTGAEDSISQPLTRIRGTDNVFHLQNNQTIAIGGFTENFAKQQQNTLPAHGLLKKVFSSKENSISRRELILLVNVKILNNRTINNQLYKSANSIFFWKKYNSLRNK